MNDPLNSRDSALSYDSLEGRIREIKNQERQLTRSIQEEESRSDQVVVQVTGKLKELFHGKNALSGGSSSSSSQAFPSRELENRLRPAKETQKRVESSRRAVNFTKRTRNTLLAVKKLFDMLGVDGQSQQNNDLNEDPTSRLRRLHAVLDLHREVNHAMSSVSNAIPALDDKVHVFCTEEQKSIRLWFKRFLQTPSQQTAAQIPNKFWSLVGRFPNLFDEIVADLQRYLEKLFTASSSTSETQNLCAIMSKRFRLSAEAVGDRCWMRIATTLLRKFASGSSEQKAALTELLQIEADKLPVVRAFLAEADRKQRRLNRNECIHAAQQTIVNSAQSQTAGGSSASPAAIVSEIVSKATDILAGDETPTQLTVTAIQDIISMFLLTRATDSRLLRDGKACAGFFATTNRICDELLRLALAFGSGPRKSLGSGPTPMVLDDEHGDDVNPVTHMEGVLAVRQALLELCLCLRETADGKLRALLDSFCEREIAAFLHNAITNAKNVNDVSTAIGEIQKKIKDLLSSIETGSQELGSEEPSGAADTMSTIPMDDLKLYISIRFVKMFGAHFQTFHSNSLDALMLQTLMLLENLGLSEANLMLLRESLQEDYDRTR